MQAQVSTDCQTTSAQANCCLESTKLNLCCHMPTSSNRKRTTIQAFLWLQSSWSNLQPPQRNRLVQSALNKRVGLELKKVAISPLKAQTLALLATEEVAWQEISRFWMTQMKTPMRICTPSDKATSHCTMSTMCTVSRPTLSTSKAESTSSTSSLFSRTPS